MFACRNLNLSYKGNKILKDIHFHIPEGTVFCITGESGSGKSSLLKVINGIIPEITEAEISGEIKLNDMRLNEMDIAQRSRYISTVYQNPKTQFYCVESTDELAFPLENRNLPKDEMVKIIKKIYGAARYGKAFKQKYFFTVRRRKAAYGNYKCDDDGQSSISFR